MSARAAKTGRGRPKGSNAESQIIEHAGKAFAEQGYHGCTVEHILEAAGASRTNFYRFFKSKEEVYEKIMEQCLVGLMVVMDSAKSNLNTMNSLEDQLALMLDAYLNAVFATGDLLPVLFVEQQSTPNHQKLRDKMLNRLKRDVNRLVVKAGHKKPNTLLLEGTLAAIDRMVYVESIKKGRIEAKIQRIQQAASKFNHLIIED